MKNYKLLFVGLLSFLTVNTVFGQINFQKEDKAFNGKNLNNWKVMPETQLNSWTVKNRILFAKSDKGETGSNLWTTKEYEDFAVHLEFKMGGGIVDSGVFIRGENPESPQIQIGISGSLKVDMTGSPYVPKQGYPLKAEVENILKNKQWNTMTILAIKNNYKVWLNGQKVLDYTLENASLKGAVGLQLHPNRTMDIEFKEIFIKKL
ncbi:MAG: DUF1080 domain-containing protein [Flavobacteriaceae bacterium]|nr:DUF1080 domain-containing protein [Flavobacteriaceae bacterium]MDG2387251.1 DUF1080 domain-containing protein [Flavobacteriaceae bacterium]